jgi:M6 family metalloprotease-like protein
MGGGGSARSDKGGLGYQRNSPSSSASGKGKAAAADLVARGKATVDARSCQLKNGTFVDYRPREPTTSSQCRRVRRRRGAAENQIPAPNRSLDNTTFWVSRHLRRDGRSGPAGVDWSPSVVDVWDRYDYDGDGNFDEPDGYIDHFQSVHAGDGEETGGGAQGSNAIWSHRWYAFYNNIGFTGPAGNLGGGIRVGGSDYWVGDYTIEPENGGVGVFAHEFGHDLGLPDLYDSVGDNATGFWTIMSSGSYGNDGTVDIGSKPTHMGAWEARPRVARPRSPDGQRGRRATLDPRRGGDRRQQAIASICRPPKTATVFPVDGGSVLLLLGPGDDVDNSMTGALVARVGRSRSGPTTTSSGPGLRLPQASTDGGATVNLSTNLSTTTSPNGQNFGNGMPHLGCCERERDAAGGDDPHPVPLLDRRCGGRPGLRGRHDRRRWHHRHGERRDPVDVRRVQPRRTDRSLDLFHYYLVNPVPCPEDTALRAYYFVTSVWVDKQCYANGVLVWY